MNNSAVVKNQNAPIMIQSEFRISRQRNPPKKHGSFNITVSEGTPVKVQREYVNFSANVKMLDSKNIESPSRGTPNKRQRGNTKGLSIIRQGTPLSGGSNRYG